MLADAIAPVELEIGLNKVARDIDEVIDALMSLFDARLVYIDKEVSTGIKIQLIMKDTEKTPAQIEARNEKITDRKRKANVILWLVIFIAGIVVGIWGLCSAVKFTFYVGLVVVAIGFIALLYCLVRLGFRRRKYFTGDDGKDA